MYSALRQRSGYLVVVTFIFIMGVSCIAAQPNNPDEYFHLLQQSQGTFEQVSWQPNGILLAVVSEEGIGFYDSSFQEVYFWNTRRTASTIAWSPDGNTLAAGIGADLLLLDTQTWEVISLIEDDSRGFSVLEFSPDGTKLASGGYHNSVDILNPVNGSVLFTLQDDHSEGVAEFMSAVAWSQQGDKLAMLNEKGDVSLWDVNTRERELVIEVEGLAIAWHPSRDLLAVSTRNDSLVLLDANESTQQSPSLSTFPLDKSVSLTQWSPDGNTLAAANVNRIYLWDTDSLIAVPSVAPDPSFLLELDGDHILSLSWNEESSEIAAVNDDGVLTIWDSTTGQLQESVSSVEPSNES